MPAQNRELSTNRIEAFSDAALAIVLTLLALELVPEKVEPPEEYLSDWPQYVAFLIAFLTIGALWINHHALFVRLKRADGPILILNLAILLGASLVPWPTAAISLALTGDEAAPQIAAIGLYAAVTCLICIPWIILDRHVVRSDTLLADDHDRSWFRRHARWAAVMMLIGGVALGVAFWSPLASLALYLVVVGVFVVARILEA